MRLKTVPPVELRALFVLLLIVVGLPTAVMGYEYVIKPAHESNRVIAIAARSPENGGFSLDTIDAAVGTPITLRFTSEDVTHGIAIGPGLGVDLGHIDPGVSHEVTLTFEHPGTYTIYCNTWCSPDHWRMRSVILVRDPNNPDVIPTAQPDPVIEALINAGIDIDAGLAHGEENGHAEPAEPVIGAYIPSASNGQAVLNTLVLPPEAAELNWRRSHTPAEALAILREDNPAASQADLLDAAAYLWSLPAVEEQRLPAAELYAKNCAACHGETGGADGPVAGMTVETPVAFDDLAHMLMRRDDVLYAKIRRGGMGTDMPNFGTLITPEETWALVSYIRTFSLSQR